MRPLVCIAFATAVVSAACGGRVPPCAVPTDAESAWRTLDGTWRVITWSESLNGTIHFDEDDVEATSEDTRFVGHWVPVSSTDNAHVIRLEFDEATVDGVRQVWADPTVLDVTVVFATTDIAWGLQPDGAWTRWERIGGCVDSAEGCVRIVHPPGALQRMLDADALDGIAPVVGTDAARPHRSDGPGEDSAPDDDGETTQPVDVDTGGDADDPIDSPP